MNRKSENVEKHRYWQRAIGDAARSGMSIRKFCRHHRLRESQFYWWQRKLKARRRQERSKPGTQDQAASFALVSEVGMDMPAGLELVLRDGRRLRISQGVQEDCPCRKCYPARMPLKSAIFKKQKLRSP